MSEFPEWMESEVGWSLSYEEAQKIHRRLAMMSLEEMESAQKAAPPPPPQDDPLAVNWSRVFAIAIGVLAAIYFSDCFRGTP